MVNLISQFRELNPRRWAAAGLDALALTAAAARNTLAEPVLSYDFAAGTDDWQTTYPGGKVAASTEKPPDGSRSLEFDYTQTATASPAFFAFTNRAAAGARSIQFSIRCSNDTPLQLLLGERDGSGYYYPFHCPAGTWVRMAVPLSDFNPAPATADEDSRFNPAELASIRFQDVTRYHAPAASLGKRQIWLGRLRLDT